VGEWVEKIIIYLENLVRRLKEEHEALYPHYKYKPKRRYKTYSLRIFRRKYYFTLGASFWFC
jgi:hypothetical protein